MQPNLSLNDLVRASLAWARSGSGVRAVSVALLTFALLCTFTLYESLTLGLPLVREEPPTFTGYYLIRFLFALAASLALVAVLVAGRAPDSGLERADLRPATCGAGWVVTLAALAFGLLLIASPTAFHALAREDSSLEWLSAGFLFVASAAFAAALLRRDARSGGREGLLRLGAVAAFALLLFVMGMEEISWMQRIFGFGTPEALAEVNWQGEFNLHNVQTDLSEAIYYVGAAIFLILLPLLRDLLPPAVAANRLVQLVPGRGVAAVSAPVAMIDYGQWDLLPIQLATMMAVAAMIAFAVAARRRGNRSESLLFLFLAAAIAGGQALFLAIGPMMIDLPDATEFKEFFIALSLAWYALSVARASALQPAGEIGEAEPA